MKNKKINIVIIAITLIIFIVLILVKDKLNCFITNYYLRNNDIIVNQNDSLIFFQQFDNTSNTYDFELSFIELGGFGCKPCMRMDTVLLELAQVYKNKVKIKTFRVTDDKGKTIAKYFGVNAIPTQIILDKNGKEVFRHTGFLSKEDLENIINEYVEKK